MSGREDPSDIYKALGFSRVSLLLEGTTHDLDQYDEEESDFVRSSKAIIRGTLEDEETGDETIVKLGYIEGALFLAGSALNAGLDIIEMADRKTQDLYTVAELVYRGEDGEVEEVDPSSLNANTLYISRFFLTPKLRGTGLARTILFRFIELHDPASLRAVVTYPSSSHLIKRGKSKDPLAKTDVAEGNVRIELFLERLGFGHLHDGFYSLDFDDDWRNQTPKPKPKKLPKDRVRQARIIETVGDRDLPNLATLDELAGLLHVSLKTIESDVAVLVDRGQVRRVKDVVIKAGGHTVEEWEGMCRVVRNGS